MRVMFFALASTESELKTRPFIEAARRIGADTFVLTHAPWPGLEIGDRNRCMSQQGVEEFFAIAREVQPDFIFTANSRLTPSVGVACEMLGLAVYSPMAARTLTHKDLWYQYLERKGFRSPRTLIPMSASEILNNDLSEKKVIVKPTFSTGAQSTHVFASGAEFVARLRVQGFHCDALDRAISEEEFFEFNRKGGHFLGKFLVQEFIEGIQIGVETAIVGGRAHLVHAAEILTLGPDQIEAYAHIGPVPIPQGVQEILQAAARDLGLHNCLLSPDVIVTESGETVILETNLNPGGEGLIDCVRLRGLDYPLQAMSGFLGLKFDFSASEIVCTSFAEPSFKRGLRREIAVETDARFPDFAREQIAFWRKAQRKSPRPIEVRT